MLSLYCCIVLWYVMMSWYVIYIHFIYFIRSTILDIYRKQSWPNHLLMQGLNNFSLLKKRLVFYFWRFFWKNIPVSTRRRFDVHTTSITLKRRRMDVKTTSCAYWDGVDRKIGKLLDILEVMVKPEWKSKRSTSKEIKWTLIRLDLTWRDNYGLLYWYFSSYNGLPPSRFLLKLIPWIFIPFHHDLL